MMNYFHKWLDNLSSRPSVTWRWSLSAWGKCRQHTGPSIWYAAVNIEITPNADFVVEDKLREGVREYCKDVSWYDQIVFGVYDVLMTYSTTPFRNFKLTILEIDFNDIESNEMAFRLAARDAASKILEATRLADLPSIAKS